MLKNKLSLGAFVKAVSQAVSEANQKLLGEADRTEGDYAPHPLCISRMRVSFSAHVTRSDRMLRDNGAAELMLDFDRNNPNFHSELLFLPFAAEAVLEEDTEPAACDWAEPGPDAAQPSWDTEPQDDTRKVAVRPLEQTGGFEYGNR